MRKILSLVYILILLISAHNAAAFSLWQICMDFNTSRDKTALSDKLNHKIINADILTVWNDEEKGFLMVKCLQGPGRHAFSNYDDGEPLYPDSSVRFQYDKTKICEGDIIYVYGRECHILSMTIKRKSD